MATTTINPEVHTSVHTARPSEFQKVQPVTTFTGAPIEPLQKGLPKTTQSVCPECLKVIEARLFEENGAVYMEKSCAEHGEFRDLIYSDARLYLKMEEFEFGDNRGLENPQFPDAARCPEDCGLCSLHTSHTVLSNRRPHQPLQPHLPGLLCQRQHRGIPVRAFLRAGARDAQDASRTAPRAQPRGAVLRRRAYHLSAFPRRPADGHGDGLHPHPVRDQRH